MSIVVFLLGVSALSSLWVKAEGGNPCGAGFQLAWEEDFVGSALNTSRWTVANNFTHNDGPVTLELFMNDECYLENGNLVLRTRRRSVVNRHGIQMNYTSCWVDTKHKVFHKFGRYLVRAKLPQPTATGIWPAHWLMPEPETAHPPDVCWPVGGEIDIMESTAVGSDDPSLYRAFGSYRWGTECRVNKQLLPGSVYPAIGDKPVNFADEYHTFGVDWTKDAIRYHIDGHFYHNKTSAEVPIPQDPFYWILDSAVAWYFPPGPDAQYPAYHLVDWVGVCDPVN